MKRSMIVACLALAGCGGGSTDVDGGRDAAAREDAGALDAGRDAGAAIDSGTPIDASTPIDAGDDAATASDAGMCEPMDVMEGTPCGPTERPARRFTWNGTSCVAVSWCRCEGTDCGGLFDDERACRAAYASCLGGGGCSTDADCPSGSEWCEGGRCVPCDNSGLVCLIACPSGWSTYMRNGCSPCECAPRNDCTSDGECVGTGGGAQRCYAGAFCWDWCPPGDPTCCFGNLCGAAGCTPPPPLGCTRRGCPLGQRCDTTMGCTPSGCGCDPTSGWFCTDDCGGGVCVPE